MTPGKRASRPGRGARGVIARRELAGVFRERTILLAVLVQVVIAGFSSVLAVGLATLVDPGEAPVGGEPGIAVNRTGIPTDLRHALQEAGLRVLPQRSDDVAWEAFRSGEADAALLVHGSEPVQLTLGLPEGDLRATLIVVKAKEALEAYERGLREERAARLSFEPVYVETDAKPGSYGFVYGLLIPLLVFVPVILAGALCADSLTEEVQRGTLPLLLASPASPAQVVEGKLLAHVALAPLLAAAWLGLLALNGLPVAPADAARLLLLAGAAAVLMGILAALVSVLTRERNKAQSVYAVGFLLLLAASLALPVPPLNAAARLAAGSAGPEADAVIAGTAAMAFLAWVVLRLALRRGAARLGGNAASS
jgi:ABC-type Na+ efflux pump permease subunit